MKNKIIILIATLIVGVPLVTPSVYCQDFPTKPVEILCILPPGSGMDLFAREVAQIAPKHLKQPVVVINKPGAGGAVAATELINSKPDGYRLVTLTNISFISVFKTQKIMFNPSQLAPIWNFEAVKQGLFVRGDSPWKTLNDLLADAKKNPGKLTWGHHLRGSSIHLGALLLFRKAGVDLVEIPHKGSAESMAALLGGHIDVLTTTFSTVTPHVNSGAFRCLVVYEDRRYKDRPEIPCAAELGYPEVGKLATYIGLFAHSNIPDKARAVLTEAMKKTCEDPAFKAGVEKMGEAHVCGGPELLKDAITKGELVVTPALKELGLYVEQK